MLFVNLSQTINVWRIKLTEYITFNAGLLSHFQLTVMTAFNTFT